MKINSIKPYRLYGENHFFFMTEVKNLIATVGPAQLNIDSIFNDFSAAYNKESDVIHSLGLSPNSANRLESSDQKRDDFYWAIGLIIKSHTKHIDINIRNSAKKLEKILNKFGNLRYEPYEEETMLISNFCHELKNFPQEVKLLGLKDWLDMLEDENIRFNDYYNSMKQEMVIVGKNSTGKLKDIRKEVDLCYKEMIDKIGALATIDGFEVYCDFIRKLNIVINNYSQLYSNSKTGEEKVINNAPPVILESFY